MTISAEEQNLLDFAERAIRNASPYYAALFNLQKLSDGLNSTALTTILSHSIQGFARKQGARVFELQNNQTMLVSEASNRLQVNNFIMEIENTLPAPPGSIANYGTFVELYDVSATPNLFLKCCQELYEEALEIEERSKIDQSSKSAISHEKPITGQVLDKILNSLSVCDISPLIRRQNVCALTADNPPKSLFREYFVSMLALSKMIAPGISVTSNPGLFRELTRTLDQRFLTLLHEDHDRFIKGTASFNMNMTSLKSNEFHAFLADIVAQREKSIVVELDFLDVLEHLQDYLTVIPFLKKKGLKILIENLRPALLNVVDLVRLDADLFKIRWNQDYVNHASQRNMFVRALDKLPASRCILTHCDSKQAINVGKQAGLQAFQGFHVDSLIGSQNSAMIPIPVSAQGNTAFC